MTTPVPPVRQLKDLIHTSRIRLKVVGKAKSSTEFRAWSGFKVKLTCPGKKATFDYFSSRETKPSALDVLVWLLADEAVFASTKTYAAFVKRCGLQMAKRSRPKRIHELLKKHHRKLKSFLDWRYSRFLLVGVQLETQLRRSEVVAAPRSRKDPLQLDKGKRSRPERRPGQLAPTGPAPRVLPGREATTE